MSPSPYERPHHPASSTSIFELDTNPSSKSRVPSKASKRIRGEIACAECRRLKIRCDKTVPCSTCVKRGCGALCPNGTIPPGEGSRFVLAATDHLRQKLVRMEARMHALEDALAILHGAESDKTHPLLLSRDNDDDDDDEPLIDPSMLDLKPVIDDETSVVDAFGSLHIDGEGGSRFFGPSGGSESLLLKAKGREAEVVPKSAPLSELDPSYLPPEINQFCNAFPFTPPGIPRTSVQEMIETFLPPVDRAIFLCETFLEHLSWMFQIVTRRQLVDELIPAIYKQTPVRVSYGPHELAVLLVTLGIGALVDFNLQPYNLEAQHYCRLARAALSLQSIMTEPSIVTVKTLHLMSIYNGLSGKEANLEASYIFLDLASQVALRIGLHIDPSMWGFTGREAYDRRLYFWNLLVAVLWQSVITGRPPSILQVFVDCKIPTEEDECKYRGGEPPIGLGVWGHHASEQCLLPTVRAALSVKSPPYDKVLELDRKIRTFAQPEGNHGDERTAVSMKNFIRGHYLDLIMLFLHRSYFAQVMIEHAGDPMKSPYAPSVSAAYQSACSVLNETLEQVTKNRLLVARVWRIWSNAFSAAVVVGTLAIRGVNLNLDPPPFERFQTAVTMFRSVAETNSRAARALPVLQSMLIKAYHARQMYLGDDVPAATPDDEITVFGGRAEPVVRSPGPASPERSSASPDAHSQGPHQLPQQDTFDSPSRRATLVPQRAPPHPPPPMAIPAPPLAGFDLGLSLGVPHDDARLAQHSWEGLFREAAGPVPAQYEHDYGMMDASVHGNGAMDDRWASLMHNYGLLEDPQPIVYA